MRRRLGSGSGRFFFGKPHTRPVKCFVNPQYPEASRRSRSLKQEQRIAERSEPAVGRFACDPRLLSDDPTALSAVLRPLSHPRRLVNDFCQEEQRKDRNMFEEGNQLLPTRQLAATALSPLSTHDLLESRAGNAWIVIELERTAWFTQEWTPMGATADV